MIKIFISSKDNKHKRRRNIIVQVIIEIIISLFMIINLIKIKICLFTCLVQVF